MRYASVYPLVSARAVARPFTYEVPDDVGKGAVVAVRFGRSQARGVVVGLEDAPPDGVKAAPVGRVLDELPPALVDLALWVAEYYGSDAGARARARGAARSARGAGSGARRPAGSPARRRRSG